MRQLISTSLIIATALALAPAAQAANTDHFSLTDWEMHDGDGVLTLEESIPRFGALRLYPLSEVPAFDDEGWHIAPSGAQIELDQRSLLCGTPTSCFDGVDFKYFQTFLMVPADASYDAITLSFDAIDDGVQVKVFNSLHPEGRTLPGGHLFMKLNLQETRDLSPLFAPGEENRIVITLADNCCGRTMLMGAQVKVDGVSISGALE